MIVAEPVTTPRSGTALHRRRAFGIEIQSSMLLPGATAAASEARSNGARAPIGTRVDRAWRNLGATRARASSTGRTPGDGGGPAFRPWLSRACAAKRAPSHLRRREVRPLGAARDRAMAVARLLFAQVLPLAATLHGLELLHASAVAWNGRALGIVAAAGTGKTSVATHLVASGGVLLTDDVLALEEVEGAIVAHPVSRSLDRPGGAKAGAARRAESAGKSPGAVRQADPVRGRRRPAKAARPALFPRAPGSRKSASSLSTPTPCFCSRTPSTPTSAHPSGS